MWGLLQVLVHIKAYPDGSFDMRPSFNRPGGHYRFEDDHGTHRYMPLLLLLLLLLLLWQAASMDVLPGCERRDNALPSPTCYLGHLHAPYTPA